MNLSSYIQSRLKQKSILLMTHVIVGYPSLEANWAMLKQMQTLGVDLVELQMPFSEPIADGPLFVKANQAALSQGIGWNHYFDLMKQASREFDFPLLFMGYYNSVFMMGHQPFCQKIQDCGGSGFIIADLPIEEFKNLFDYSHQYDLSPILLTTPTNTESRLKQIFGQSKGFIYCVARKGVTGKKTDLNQEVEIFVERCRKFSNIPLALGFGLTHPEDLKALHKKVEIGIVGTALLRAWEENGEVGYQAQLKQLIQACYK